MATEAEDTEQKGHAQRIKAQYESLVGRLSCFQEVVGMMYEKEKLKQKEMQEILKWVRSNEFDVASENLFEIVMSGPTEVYECFLEALKQTRQKHVYNMLVNEKKRLSAEEEHALPCNQIRLIYRWLIVKLDVNMDLLSGLYEKKVLAKSEFDKFTADRPELSNPMTTSCFLSIIGRKSNDDFETFKKILPEIGQRHVSERFSKSSLLQTQKQDKRNLNLHQVRITDPGTESNSSRKIRSTKRNAEDNSHLSELSIKVLSSEGETRIIRDAVIQDCAKQPWEEHGTIIREKYNQLVSNLSCLGDIIVMMYENMKLTSKEFEHIQSLHSTPIRANEELLSIIARKPRDVYECFLSLIKSTNQLHLYQMLVSGDDKEHGQIIQMKYNQLVSNLSCLGDILAMMFQKQKLTFKEFEHIQSLQSTPIRANEELLSIIARKPRDVYECFLSLIKSTNQLHLYQMLVSGDHACHKENDHKDLICRNFMWLSEKLDTENGLISLLYQQNVLTVREEERISCVANIFRKNEFLLGLLSNKSSKEFETFLEVLEESGQGYVSEKLRKPEACDTADRENASDHKDLIGRNFMWLSQKLDTESGLISLLFQQNVLTVREKERIFCVKDTFQKNELLLGLLSMKSSKEFEKFLKALEESGQGHLTQKLRKPPVSFTKLTLIPPTVQKPVSSYKDLLPQEMHESWQKLDILSSSSKPVTRSPPKTLLKPGQNVTSSCSLSKPVPPPKPDAWSTAVQHHSKAIHAVARNIEKRGQYQKIKGIRLREILTRLEYQPHTEIAIKVTSFGLFHFDKPESCLKMCHYILLQECQRTKKETVARNVEANVELEQLREIVSRNSAAASLNEVYRSKLHSMEQELISERFQSNKDRIQLEEKIDKLKADMHNEKAKCQCHK